MKFEDLPYDMLLKVMHTVDQDTFESLKFTNSSIQQISTNDRFICQHVKEIRFEKDHKFYATFRDGSDILIGPRKHLGKQTPREKSICARIRKMTHLPTLTFKNCRIQDADFVLLLACSFSRLRTVKKLNLENCMFKCSEFNSGLKKWNIKDLSIRKKCSQNWNFSDETFTLLSGNVDIDVDLTEKENHSNLTDKTLIHIVDKKREIFKLTGLCTNFSMNRVAEAIDIAIEEHRTVFWDFGVLAHPRWLKVKQRYDTEELELMRKVLAKHRNNGCVISNKKDEYRHTIIKMKFENLPYDMLLKVMHTVDQDTFESLKFSNSSIQQISTNDLFICQHVKQIRFENDDKFYATLRDGTDILIGPLRHLGEQTPREKSICARIRKVTDLQTLAFTNCKIKDAVLELIVACAFPKLRTVKTINLENCIFECSKFNSALRKWKVKDLRIRETSALYWNFNDETFTLLSGNVDIDVDLIGNDNYSNITDNTLIHIVDGKRKIFKLTGLCTNFSLNRVAEAIDIAMEENRTVNWDFGVIANPAWLALRKQKYANEREPMRKVLAKYQNNGCVISSKKNDYQHTITKIERPGITIQFTTAIELGV